MACFLKLREHGGHKGLDEVVHVPNVPVAVALRDSLEAVFKKSSRVFQSLFRAFLTGRGKSAEKGENVFAAERFSFPPFFNFLSRPICGAESDEG